eukprot:3743954-Ditylum_brightwellii.AAC.1
MAISNKSPPSPVMPVPLQTWEIKAMNYVLLSFVGDSCTFNTPLSSLLNHDIGDSRQAWQ